MKQPLLVLSSSSMADIQANQSLVKTLSLAAVIEAFNPKIVFELPIRRAGQEGWIGDNPPIEDIDPLFNATQETPFGALRIPIDLDQPENKVGEEISAIDGWADLASYADITLARLFFVHSECIETPHIQYMLKEILHYLNDMHIFTSLRLPPSFIAARPEFLETLLRDPDFHGGLDLPMNLNDLDAPHAVESPLIQTLSAALPESYTADDLCAWFEKMLARSSPSAKAIVFELPSIQKPAS